MRAPFILASTVLALATAFAAVAFQSPSRAEEAFVIPAPASDLPAGSPRLQTVVLAGGCFWGVQAVFQHTNGVTKAVSGYSGGTKETAQYEVVSRGQTAHAEAVEVTYDPSKVSYGKLLQIFFSVAHDPTQLNRQGPDSGTQYRSAIFYSSPEQKKVTEDYIAQLNATGVYKKPIVTKIDPLKAFYPAEDYHQDYATLHPNQPYIYINDRPKVENLKRLFGGLYREKPVLLRSASN